MWPVFIFEIWTEFWNLQVSFEHRQRDFKVLVEISLVYWRYKAMNFSLHYTIKYFKSNNCLQIFCFVFLFVCLFVVVVVFFFFGKISREIFKIPFKCRTLQNKNSNVHFILGNTGHTWRRLNVPLFNLSRFTPVSKNSVQNRLYTSVIDQRTRENT